ncbi:unnamed protein product [Diatraea saccharalis]|uniref:Translin-associated factor X-interacting protein 1 N-terminal domain-containing protein n=1 Tax=Diatraea saccharalis TaxID=40085 RepID=A0A9N9REZ0_9NEOP|nr:unnamed protein product [Diatraea saccharalis]
MIITTVTTKFNHRIFLTDINRHSTNMSCSSSPKWLREIVTNVTVKLKFTKKPENSLLESNQLYYDEVLKIYREAFEKLIECSITFSDILMGIKDAYEDALRIRDHRISHFKTQDVSIILFYWFLSLKSIIISAFKIVIILYI